MPVIIMKEGESLRAVEGDAEALRPLSQSADDYAITSGSLLDWKAALACKETVCFMGVCDGEVVFDKNKGKLLTTIIALGLIDEAESEELIFSTGSYLRPFGSKKSFDECFAAKKKAGMKLA